MKTLKKLNEIEVLDSSKMKLIKGGLIDGDSARGSQSRGVKATCNGEYADESGQKRTDNFVGGPDGGYWVFGPWNSYCENCP